MSLDPYQLDDASQDDDDDDELHPALGNDLLGPNNEAPAFVLSGHHPRMFASLPGSGASSPVPHRPTAPSNDPSNPESAEKVRQSLSPSPVSRPVLEDDGHGDLLERLMVRK